MRWKNVVLPVLFLLTAACSPEEASSPKWSERSLPVVSGVRDAGLAFAGGKLLLAGVLNNGEGFAALMTSIGWDNLSVGLPDIGDGELVSAVLPDGSPLLLAVRGVDLYRGSLLVYSNNAWETLSGFFSDGPIYEPVLLSPDGGSLFAAASDSSNQFRLLVREYVSGWQDVGAGIVSTVDGLSPALSWRSGRIRAAYSDWSVSGKLSVSEFGASWTLSGSAGFSFGYADRVRLSVTGGGDIFAACRETDSTNRNAVYRNASGVWVEDMPEGFAGSAVFDMREAADGSVRVVSVRSNGTVNYSVGQGVGWTTTVLPFSVSNVVAVALCPRTGPEDAFLVLEGWGVLRLFLYE